MTVPRRALTVTTLALALLAAIDTAGWVWITFRLRAGWAQWCVQAQAAGLQLQSAPPINGGWPFAAEITVRAVSLDAGLATWRADSLRLAVSVWHPRLLAITLGEGALGGGESLRLASWPPVSITADSLGGVIPLDDPEQWSVAGRGLAVASGAGRLQVATLSGRTHAGALDVAASGLVIPGAGLPFAGVIDHVSAQVSSTIPVPRTSGARQDPAQTAAAWAGAGGEMVLNDIDLGWGPLEAHGRATAGLDPALQPRASGTLHMVGYDAGIDALARAGTLGRGAARVAATVLDMMAAATDPPSVDVPFTLQGGTLAVGAIPLARIPPLKWP